MRYFNQNLYQITKSNENHYYHRQSYTAYYSNSFTHGSHDVTDDV